MTTVMLGSIARMLTLTVDGEEVRVPEGATILDVLNERGTETPTLCWAPNLTPINACRVCMVEVEGSRVLVPSCARKVEDGMVVRTDSEKVRHSRRMVLELLASSVDLSQASADVQRWMREYGVDAGRYGPPAPPSDDRDTRHAGHHHAPDGSSAETVAQPVKVDNDLYVRDYARCILCYKCVKACGTDAQFTFAISAAGRGFDARIATEQNVELPDSACVYCGNCIGVCPTGRAEVGARARAARGGRLASGTGVGHHHDLLVLRRGLQPRAARPRGPDRERDEPFGPLGHPRPPVHQGPLRLPARPESPHSTVISAAGTAAVQRKPWP